MVVPAYVQSLSVVTLSTHFDPSNLLVCDMNKLCLLKLHSYVCRMHVAILYGNYIPPALT